MAEIAAREGADVSRFAYLRSLFEFAFRNNPLLYVTLALSAVSVFLEIAAMTVLLPLVTVVSGSTIDSDQYVVRALTSLAVPVDGQSLLLLFILLFAGRIVTQFGSQGLIIYLGRKLLLQLNARAFGALVRNMPIKDLEARSIGYYITLAGDEANRASNLIVFVSQFVSIALLGALYFLAVAYYSPAAAGAVLIFLAVTFLALFESFRVSHRLGSRQIEQSQELGSLFLDSLNGLRSVRAFAVEEYVIGTYYNLIRNYVRTLVITDVVSLAARLGPALLLLSAVVLVAMWPFAREQLSFDLPYLVTLIVLLMRFFPITGQALNLALRVVADARAGRDVTHVIEQYEHAPMRAGGAILGEVSRIDANTISFSHVGSKPVLERADLALRRGSSYALAGVSGSGKSTFLDLMLGFYPPDSGRITINGVDLSTIGLTELRRRIVLVTQDVTIFNDTIMNNVRFGIDASPDDVQRACQIAGIDVFIETLPQRYETPLNYRGSNLSGGQKQRIGIARAVLRRPDVLLLDESTAALDVETRESVVAKLLDEFRNRIILFVTHDQFVMSKVDVVMNMADINGLVREVPASAGVAG